MRVLRIFFVAAQFPVDGNYRRGNMKCKACQELCRTDSCTVTLCLLSTTDCSIVTLCPTSVLASPLECAHPKNVPVNPMESAITKSLDLNSPEINTCRKCGRSPLLLVFCNLRFLIGLHQCSSGVTPLALLPASARRNQSLTEFFRSFLAFDPLGGHFDLVHALEGKQQFDEEFGRVFRGLLDDVADGVGDGGVEQHALHLHASQVDAHHLPQFEGGFHEVAGFYRHERGIARSARAAVRCQVCCVVAHSLWRRGSKKNSGRHG